MCDNSGNGAVDGGGGRADGGGGAPVRRSVRVRRPSVRAGGVDRPSVVLGGHMDIDDEDDEVVLERDLVSSLAGLPGVSRAWLASSNVGGAVGGSSSIVDAEEAMEVDGVEPVNEEEILEDLASDSERQIAGSRRRRAPSQNPEAIRSRRRRLSESAADREQRLREQAQRQSGARDGESAADRERRLREQAQRQSGARDAELEAEAAARRRRDVERHRRERERERQLVPGDRVRFR
jgi:hypothetical protein